MAPQPRRPIVTDSETMSAPANVAQNEAAAEAMATLRELAAMFDVSVKALHLVFDREDGLLRSEQTILGIRRRSAIPLFHLRAVVVAARRGEMYVAYVERRMGGTIHLDEARKPGPLLALAEAIADVAELRLVYDATTRMAASD